ncbi:MAG TPA: OmpA family protein [Balneolaceae bacterium]|nr:OmpA family protein [Balneolaceae bacterium]
MTITANKSPIILLLLIAGILFSSCRTSEEIVEPEPEPEAPSEQLERETFEEPEPESDTSDFVEELHTITFGFDRDNINDAAARLLAENVRMLRENPDTRVRVDAYTDHVGGDQYNLRLSLRRASSVVDFYTQNGIAQSRIESRGLGKAPVPCSQMEMDSDTPGCEKNRRAESHPLNTGR